MRAYSIFDDFSQNAVSILEAADVEVRIHPKGRPRPEAAELQELLKAYDILFISTAQKITETMLADVSSPKIIATVSIGTDHISVPEDKKDLVRIVNAPSANRISVAEHTFGLIIALKKQFTEARTIAVEGKSKKEMYSKPEDLFGCTFGIVGAGGIATEIIRMASVFGIKLLCWTRAPERHPDLLKNGVCFCELDELLSASDIISVNLPLTSSTKNLISSSKVDLIKNDAVFISTSRAEVIDIHALLNKAKENSSFRLGLDVDAVKAVGLWTPDMSNIIVTPHIAGGTVEARERMFAETAKNTAIRLAEWKKE